MPQKGRLTPSEKKKVVEEWLSGNESICGLARKYGISDTTVRDWIRLYKTRGGEGLIPAAQIRKYSVEVKTRAVEEYLSGEVSQSDICAKYDISDRRVLRGWIKRYNSHEDFKEPNNGGVIGMAKGRKTTQEERIEIVSHCISNNKEYGRTIDQYSVSYQQLYGWVRKYEKDGVDGLADRRGKRKDEASMTEVEKLRARIKLKEAENLRLQMENDLLKKVKALERGRGGD